MRTGTRRFTVMLAVAAMAAPLVWAPAPVAAQIPAYEGPPPTAVYSYGDDDLQWGALRMPEGPGPFPLAIVVHGGCWRAGLGDGSLTPLAAALTDEGIATWDIEYRRVGHDGGGWPGTFLDLGAAVDYARVLGGEYPLDMDRVTIVGHSSGAHFAVWAAARPGLPEGSEIRGEDPLQVRSAVAIDGPVDLVAARQMELDARACGQPFIQMLMEGEPQEQFGRYEQASPAQMPAIDADIYLTPAAMMLSAGAENALSRRAEATGETVRIRPVPESDHFQLITPSHATFQAVLETVQAALQPTEGEIAERGASVMPFDLERTTHVFDPLQDGGLQAVVSDDGDAEQIRLIREHLAYEAERFARGDFHDPAMIHGHDMAGLHTLMMGYERMTVTYREVEAGAEILYESEDPEIVHAIHQWFEQQVRDHGAHAQGGGHGGHRQDAGPGQERGHGGEPQPQEVASDPEVQAQIELFSAWVEGQIAIRGLPGIVVGVVAGDDLIWAQGFGYADVDAARAMTTDTRFRMASHSKLFTATAIMQLREQGLLRLDDPVTDYLPWFQFQEPAEGDLPVTIEHLLTHASGLPREAGSHWTDLDFPTREEVRELMADRVAPFSPEVRWKYSNLAYTIAGLIVEEVSGLSWADYLQANIFDPLGMDASSVDVEDPLMAVGYGSRMPDGSRQVFPFVDARGMAAATGLTSTVEDMARFVSAQFREGARGDDRLLSTGSLREMHRVRMLETTWTRGQGIGFSVQRIDDRIYVGHGGGYPGYTTNTHIQLDDEVGVIVLTNTNDSNPSQMSGELMRTVGRAVAAATAVEPDVVAWDPAWERFEGTYRSRQGEVQVLVMNERLVYMNPWSSSISTTELEPVGDGTFRLTGRTGGGPVGEIVRFVEENGQVVRMVRGDSFSVRVR